MTDAAAAGIVASRLTMTTLGPGQEYPAPGCCRDGPGHVVCEDRGDIVVRCPGSAGAAQEKLVRAFAAILDREVEIVRLRVRIAELQSTVAGLDALCAASTAAAHDGGGRTQQPHGQHNAVAPALANAKRGIDLPEARDDGGALIEAHVSLPGLLEALAGPWGRCLETQTADTGCGIDGGRSGDTARAGYPSHPTL